MKLFEDALQKYDNMHFHSCQELKENDLIDFAVSGGGFRNF
jgi:hypothetical protein